MNKLLTRVSFCVLILVLICACDQPVKSQVNSTEEMGMSVDSTAYKTADTLLRYVSAKQFGKAKLYCATDCVLGYFLKMKIDSIDNYKINKTEKKKGLDIIWVQFNDSEEQYRLVFNKNKLVFIWPKKRMIWNDCLPNEVVWDLIYEISEEEREY